MTFLRNRVVSDRGRTNLVEPERGEWGETVHWGASALELMVGYRVYSILHTHSSEHVEATQKVLCPRGLNVSFSVRLSRSPHIILQSAS